MKRYLFILLVLIVVFLVLFGIVEILDISFLKDPAYLKEESGILAALISIGFLTSDILLPVPGSIVMIGNGALFGIAAGTMVSLTGGLLSSLIGFWFGRKSSRYINRFTTVDERKKGQQFLERYGVLAIIISRPVPLVSEAIAIMSGSMGYISTWKMFFASFLGLLPGALIYALVGVNAVDMESSSWSFLFVIGIAGCFWLVGLILRRTSKSRSTT